MAQKTNLYVVIDEHVTDAWLLYHERMDDCAQHVFCFWAFTVARYLGDFEVRTTCILALFYPASTRNTNYVLPVIEITCTSCCFASTGF